MTDDEDLSRYILVYATHNLAPDLRRGEVVLVDPDLPDIGDLLTAQLLVPLPADQQPRH